MTSPIPDMSIQCSAGLAYRKQVGTCGPPTATCSQHRPRQHVPSRPTAPTWCPTSHRAGPPHPTGRYFDRPVVASHSPPSPKPAADSAWSRVPEVTAPRVPAQPAPDDSACDRARGASPPALRPAGGDPRPRPVCRVGGSSARTGHMPLRAGRLLERDCEILPDRCYAQLDLGWALTSPVCPH